MDFKQIETFLAIVRYQSVTRVAEALYISQSSVSHRLKMLEEELGTLLINRSKGVSSISLTPKGKDFIPLAREWAELHEKTCRFRESEEVQLFRIAAPESINLNFLDRFYNAVLGNESGTLLSIQTCQSREVMSLLEKQEIDLGFSYYWKDDNSIIMEEMGRQTMVIVEKSRERCRGDLPSPAVFDPAREIYVKGIVRDITSIAKWHEKWFDPSVLPFVEVDTPSMIFHSMADNCWCLVTESIAKSLEADGSFHIYHFQEPPELIFYAAMHRYPKAETAAALRLFEKYKGLIRRS